MTAPTHRPKRAPGAISVLLVEDNPGDARLVREMMADAGPRQFRLTHARLLSEARSLLDQDRFDAVVLDLSLPDAQELEALVQIRERSPQVPIVVLSGRGDEALALKALQQGAQDYLVKGVGVGDVLPRTLRYAIERHRNAQRIDHLAHHDPLTNLPNRRLFMDRLEQALARTRRNHQILAVFFLDLDGFKSINDTLGHSAGDQVLQEVARRLTGCMRASDTVARLAGDEFTAILSEVSRLDDVSIFARKILAAFQAPVSAGGSEVHLTASLGASLYPNDGNDAERLMRNADAAMYRAKQKGGDTSRFYHPALDRRVCQGRALADDLRDALKGDELVLHYQPEVDVRTGILLATEALVRWQHPRLGLLPPAEFIPVAEKTDLIEPLNNWVLKRGCAQMRSWREQGLHEFRLAVNLSSRECRCASLVEEIERVLHDGELGAAGLELELTESEVLQTGGAALRTLERLRRLGLRLTIDDFGTGQSSLNHLRGFPIDSLKIDRSIIRRMLTHSQDATIVSAMIAMAHGLHVQAAAAGVETAPEWAFLREHGCDQAQGFYFSPPLSADGMTRLLRQKRCWNFS